MPVTLWRVFQNTYPYLSYFIFLFLLNQVILFLIVQRRFCSNLGMSNQTVKAAQESVQKSEEFDIR